MGLFKKKNQQTTNNSNNDTVKQDNSALLAQRALDYIADGVVMIDGNGMIQFANPAAAAMTGYDSPQMVIGLDYQLVLRLEGSEGEQIDPTTTKLYTALKTNEAITTREYMLAMARTDRRTAVALSCIPTGGVHDFKIITFRDITKELAEENEQTEFISTASHEMRTPVASIEGYLGLALNPQTATIDARAKQYLEAAHSASQHLGHLFKELLDVTKLDDSRLRPHLVPVDATEIVRQIAEQHIQAMADKNLRYSFGTNEVVAEKKHIEPNVYMATDVDFLREIMDNLIENAIKYTPEGGEIWVNVRGDGDQVLINVTDTGIGVSPEDAGHIFQKFYRVDNSQTRQIGGTGLGLYLVKQRVEALGGRVWVESSFGDGSTFYVALPRISDSDFEKMKIAQANEQMIQNFSATQAGRPVEGAQIQPTAKQQVTIPPNAAPATPAANLVQPVASSAAAVPQAVPPVQNPVVAAPVASQPTPTTPTPAPTQPTPSQPQATAPPTQAPVTPQAPVAPVQAPATQTPVVGPATNPVPPVQVQPQTPTANMTPPVINAVPNNQNKENL